MKLKLRQVAEKIGVTPATVHDAEVRGLRTVRAAQRYAGAFPGKTWLDLIDTPAITENAPIAHTPARKQ